MRVVFDGTIERIKDEIRDFLDMISKDTKQRAKEYRAPMMLPLLPEKPREQRKQEDIADIKAAYYAAKAQKKEKQEEDRTKELEEAEKRMDPVTKKKGRPKGSRGSRYQQRADEIVKAVDEEGKSFSQIGREMGCSYKTISVIYYKAKGVE